MPKSLTKEVRHDIEQALEDVARSLAKAAEGYSEDASTVVAKAAKDVKRAAERMRSSPVAAAAKDVASKAISEAKEHPIASLAAAITAAAALVGILASTLNKDD